MSMSHRRGGGSHYYLDSPHCVSDAKAPVKGTATRIAVAAVHVLFIKTYSLTFIICACQNQPVREYTQSTPIQRAASRVSKNPRFY
jgi:hypothetical protein